MKSQRFPFYFLLIILLIISLACGVSFSGNDPSEEEIKFELTRQALQKTQTAAAAPPANDVVISDDSSSDDQDSDEADISESDDDDDSDDTCNQSKFVSETIPDGSVYQPGDSFTKSWVIRNDGSCEWTTGYRFVFEEGDQMDGPTSMTLDHTVSPGGTYNFEIDLTAPTANGDYTGVWRIKSDDGKNLGKYWVMITVGPSAPPPAAFAVTSVTFYMPHTSIDMGCPGDVVISADIKTSAAGVVSYKFEDSKACPSVTKSINFTSAGSKIIQHTMNITATGDHWAKIYIDLPNHQYFGPINFHVNCTP
ncbi:MAG: NBR1-Ig-like domain-containing protein [Pelolinea sp.]|nr:NBR1-Ig-like domain-containing protein [Pelolinea sp.]